MISVDYVRQMAAYNQWMNDKLYAAAASLPPALLDAADGSFFGSISGTLHHLLVGDTIWLQRFAAHPAAFAALQPLLAEPAPPRLDSRVADDLPALRVRRQQLDAIITQWSAALTPAALSLPLSYRNMRGETHSKPFAALIVHFFNHQSHHRGQASTQLYRQGADIGVTDLLALLPDC